MATSFTPLTRVQILTVIFVTCGREGDEGGGEGEWEILMEAAHCISHSPVISRIALLKDFRVCEIAAEIVTVAQNRTTLQYELK